MVRSLVEQFADKEDAYVDATKVLNVAHLTRTLLQIVASWIAHGRNEESR